ncbi:MAG: E3 binding domain-containing protein, partial [Acetobacteraceae bacterium]|nr:E3 binding domain-containing protein [Acetobacteraceae bacterium]
MATNILMPALSPTMTEGTLSRWLKKEGEPVRAGDVIAEIETDKATMEVEAVDEGVLGKILINDGTEGVKVNEPIAILVGEGEAVPASPAPRAAAPTADLKPEAPRPQPAPETPPVPAPRLSANGGGGDGQRIFVSPLARRMAKQAGIELSGLRGSGPNGRIVKADIEAAQKAPATARPAGPGPA